MDNSPTSHFVDEKQSEPAIELESVLNDASVGEHQPVSARFKEGGLAGWLTVFGAFWGLFATYGQVSSFGSYQAYYLQHQLSDYTASDISWIGSFQLWAFTFSGIVIGRLVDAHGPKRLMLAGALVFGFSLMMASLCTKYYQFILAQGVLSGIGNGLVFYPAIISTQTHFLRLGGTASSIAYVGASLGGIVFPIMYQNLFPQVGFGWTVRIVGFVCLACCLVTWACCTSRLPPREPGPLFDLSAFRDVKFMTFTAGACIASLGLFVPFFFAAQFAEEVLHSTPSVAFDVIAVMNAGSVVGRPIPGLLADLLGCYNLAVPSLLVAGLLVLAVWLTSHSLAALMCFAAFYGMFSGIFIALNPPCLVRISRLEDIGSRMGLLFAITSFWSLVGGPIAGAIFVKQHGSFDGLRIFGGATMLLGGSIIGCVKFQINRNVWAKV